MAIIEKRTWIERYRTDGVRSRSGRVIHHCSGIFLFGFIPLYIKRGITTLV
jgi:hypothetical protein